MRPNADRIYNIMSMVATRQLDLSCRGCQLTIRKITFYLLIVRHMYICVQRQFIEQN